MGLLLQTYRFQEIWIEFGQTEEQSDYKTGFESKIIGTNKRLDVAH